jgi:hypothetical protein
MNPIQGETMNNKDLTEKMRELETRLVTLEKRKRQKRLAWLAAVLLTPVGLWAATVIPNGFTDGDTLSAAKLNENFQALAAKIDAIEGKSWRLIYETDVTSATQTVNISNLNGDVDIQYQIRCRFVAGAVSSNFWLRPNGDATAAKYGIQDMYGSSTGAANASQTTSGLGFEMGAGGTPGHINSYSGDLYAKSGTQRQLLAIFGTGSAGTTIDYVRTVAGVWNDTSSNITSLSIYSSVANGIGAGSHIEIWARR